MKLVPINPHFNACDQKWELMPEQEHGGRLCEACERVLVDFTQLSEQQLLHQQKDNNYKLCGRYTRSQVDRLHRHLTMEESQYKRPWLVSLVMGVGSLLPVGMAAQNMHISIVPDPIHIEDISEEFIGEIEILEHPKNKKTSSNPLDSIKISIPIKQSVPLPSVPGGLRYPLIVTNNAGFIVEGLVTEKETGEALIGVNVYSPFLSTGTTTDIDGKFRFQVPHDSASITISFSYIGFKEQEITITSSEKVKTLHVQLESGNLQGLIMVVGGPMKITSKPKKATSWLNPALWYRRIKHRITYR